MKVICNREQLAEGLAIASSVTSSRSPRPILQCLRVQAGKEDDTLKLFATDLELGVRFELPEVQVEKEGQAVVNASKLYSVVHELSDEVITLEVEEEALCVLASCGEFRLYTFPPEEFPPVSLAEDGREVKIASGDLEKLISLTAYAVARETTRYAINGLLFSFSGSSAVVVGTDGRRLAKASVALPGKVEEADCILPTRTAQMAGKLAGKAEGDVTVRLTDNQVAFTCEGTSVVSTLVEGKFPNYEAVIPKDSVCKVVVSRDELIRALRRAAVLASEDSHGVRVRIAEGQMLIESQSHEMGEAHLKLPVSQEGEEMQIAFNPSYMIEPLRALETEEVTLEFKAPNSPIVLKAGGNFVYVLMPVTI